VPPQQVAAVAELLDGAEERQPGPVEQVAVQVAALISVQLDPSQNCTLLESYLKVPSLELSQVAASSPIFILPTTSMLFCTLIFFVKLTSSVKLAISPTIKVPKIRKPLFKALNSII